MFKKAKIAFETFHGNLVLKEVLTFLQMVLIANMQKCFGIVIIKRSPRNKKVITAKIMEGVSCF